MTHLSNLSIFFPLCGPLGENEPTFHTKGAYKKTLSIRVIIHMYVKMINVDVTYM